MMLDLSLRVSWICVLFSCAAAFPATKGDYNYPYRLTWSSSGGPGGSRPPLQSQPGALTQGPSSSSSVGAPGADAVPVQSYEPNRFLVSGSSGSHPGPAEAGGYVRGPSNPGVPRPVSGPGDNTAGLYYPVAQPSGFVHAPSGHPSGAGSQSWGAEPAGGVDISFPDPSAWMPSRPFPDVDPWNVDAADVTLPLPSTFIIQSRNGFQRAREVLTHMKYSPEDPEPPIVPEQPNPPDQLPPRTGSKGGKGFRG